MEIIYGYSDSYDQSLQLAAQACRDQDRTGNNTLDITHLFHVSVILLRHGFPDDVAVAGLLHGSVEDHEAETPLAEAQLETSRAELVSSPPGCEANVQSREHSWALQKRDELDRARQAGWKDIAVICASALLDARRTARYMCQGDSHTCERHSRASMQTLDYCLHVLLVARKVLGHHPLVDELANAAQELMWTVELTTGRDQARRGWPFRSMSWGKSGTRVTSRRM
jgi:(p)ppGpp synthase/HD superfamily hydrolase